jgi:hypothetical protein
MFTLIAPAREPVDEFDCDESGAVYPLIIFRERHRKPQTAIGRHLLAMLHKLWEGFQLVFVVAFVMVLVLSKAAGRNPHVAWLRKFEFHDHRTEEQKRRGRRSQNIMSGLEMIFMGLALPPLYLFSTVLFFFSGINPVILTGTIALSLVMIVSGIGVILKTRA